MWHCGEACKDATACLQCSACLRDKQRTAMPTAVNLAPLPNTNFGKTINRETKQLPVQSLMRENTFQDSELLICQKAFATGAVLFLSLTQFLWAHENTDELFPWLLLYQSLKKTLPKPWVIALHIFLMSCSAGYSFLLYISLNSRREIMDGISKETYWT